MPLEPLSYGVRLREQSPATTSELTLILHARMHPSMSRAETSVRVSRDVLQQLDRLKETFHVRTADETIRVLIRERRSRALTRMLGSGKGVVTPFSEEDRLETHD